MYLLQAAIGFGMAIVTVVAVVFIIGLPMLTMILFKMPPKDERVPHTDSAGELVPKQNVATGVRLFKSFIIALAVIVLLLMLGLLLLGIMFPSFE